MAEMEKCPECDMELPTDDLWAQVAHMEATHPGVIKQRLKDAGFEEQPDGSWEDLLAVPE